MSHGPPSDLYQIHAKTRTARCPGWNKSVSDNLIQCLPLITRLIVIEQGPLLAFNCRIPPTSDPKTLMNGSTLIVGTKWNKALSFSGLLKYGTEIEWTRLVSENKLVTIILSSTAGANLVSQSTQIFINPPLSSIWQ